MSEADVETAQTRLSPWAPLRYPVFKALFIAQLASNIGTLMQSVGSAWLMGDLGASPLLIALVPDGQHAARATGRPARRSPC